MAWNVQMSDKFAASDVGDASWELFCLEHRIQCDGTMLSDANIFDDAYRPAWWETVEHMSCNAFVLELTTVGEGPVRHGDTDNEVFYLLENNPSPDWFPVGNGALEIAMDSPVGKRPGGGKKPQVRNTTSKPVSEHIITLDNTAHTAHARVVPTCRRPLSAL